MGVSDALITQQAALPTDTASQVAPTDERSGPYLTFGHELSASLPTTAPSLRARDIRGERSCALGRWAVKRADHLSRMILDFRIVQYTGCPYFEIALARSIVNCCLASSS